MHIKGINKRGFTFIELMLVVIIITVLTAMIAPRIAGRTQEAKIAVANADIEANISMALDLFEVDNGRFPTNEEGLDALFSEPASAGNWNGPYLKKKSKPLDPWKNQYIYKSPGDHNTRDYDLMSYGPDGVESDDDITNWSEE